MERKKIAVLSQNRKVFDLWFYRLTIPSERKELLEAEYVCVVRPEDTFGHYFHDYIKIGEYYKSGRSIETEYHIMAHLVAYNTK